MFERIRIVNIFNELLHKTKKKYIITSQNAVNKYGIFISDDGIRDLMDKWRQTKYVADIPRNNKCKSLIIDAGILAITKALLKNPFLTGKINKKFFFGLPLPLLLDIFLGFIYFFLIKL